MENVNTRTEKATAKVEKYDYSWDTPEKIIENIHTVREFPSWSKKTLAEISGTDNPEVYRVAHELWLKLKDAFNAEAEWYDENLCDSDQEAYWDDYGYLGSVGPVEEREVMRGAWFDTVDEDGKYAKLYEPLTSIIEALHHHEKLETGTIFFGS